MTIDELISMAIWDYLRLADKASAERMIVNRFAAWLRTN